MASLQHNFPQSQVTEVEKSRQSLVAKLAEACDAVGGVEKKGRNEFQRYNYVKAADVAKAIRHELFSRGILTLISEKEWKKIADIPTNSGNVLALMQLSADVTFVDGMETVGPLQAFGTAMDSGDKAIYKAKTGILKYALRDLGLIPDEKDDPEFDEDIDEQTDPRVLQPGEKKGRGKRKKIMEFQVRAWDAACHKSGKTAEQIASFLRVRFSAASVTEITVEDFTDAIKWAMGVEEMEKTLATSATAITRKKAQPIVESFDQRTDDELAGD